MIQTEGQGLETTTVLDYSSKSEEEESKENASNSEPQQAERDVGAVPVSQRQ